MGHTLQLDLPENVFRSLEKEAKKKGQVPETLAVQLLAGAIGDSQGDPMESFFGTFDSQGLDWVNQHDQYLAEGKIRHE